MVCIGWPEPSTSTDLNRSAQRVPKRLCDLLNQMEKRCFTVFMNSETSPMRTRSRCRTASVSSPPSANCFSSDLIEASWYFVGFG